MTISAGKDYVWNGINGSDGYESVKSLPNGHNGSQKDHGLQIPQRLGPANGHLDFLKSNLAIMNNDRDTHHDHADAISRRVISHGSSIENGFDTQLSYSPGKHSGAAEPIAIVGMGMSYLEE